MRRREAPAILATLVLTALALTLSLQLWRAQLSVPFTSAGDAAFNEMTVQNIIDTGWYENAPRLGAPFGASLYDFPQGGDNLQFLMIRGLTLFSSDAGVVTNAYFLLTFLLVGLAGLLVLRWLGLSRSVATVLAVLYALLPYHFFRGEAHLFLSGYFAVPIGIALAVTTARGGGALFRRRDDGRGPLAYATRRTAGTLGLVAVIGSAGAYYAAFTIVLLGAGAGLQALRARSLRAAVPAAMVAAAIVAVLGLNLVPNLAYRSSHGANPGVAQRDPAESERFGLKLSAMLLPDPGHRVASLAALGRRYRAESDVPSEGGQSLGTVAAVGLLWLLAIALGSIAGGRAVAGSDETHRTLAFLAVVSLLTGTIGGFSVLVAYFLTPQFRSWNRFSVFIAFLALAAVGLLLDGRRARSASGPRPAAALAMLLVFGLLDQTSAGAVPAYRANAASHASDRAFVAAIEQRLPEGAMVYQLPSVTFPESGAIASTGAYDQFRGYFLSKHLRWSFGGMQGRHDDWQEALSGQPVDLFLARIAAVGFAGLWVDREGYLDQARMLEADLATRLGPPLISTNGRLSFFALDPVTASQRGTHTQLELDALTAQTLAPAQAFPGPGTLRHREDGMSGWIDGQASAVLYTTNPGRAKRTIVFDARIEAAGPGTVTITWPDGSTEAVPVVGGETPLHQRVVILPGDGTIRFRSETPTFPARLAKADTRFRLLDPAVYDEPPTGF